MNERISMRIFADGTVQAETQGIKGKRCTDYISILEELLDAEVINSEYTAEYYETEQVWIEEVQRDRIQLGGR